MSEAEELQHRERSSRGGYVVAVGAAVLLAVDVLSPPFVIMLAQSMAMTGWDGFFRDVLMIYAPLEYLADQVRWIGNFYDWYLALFGVP